jgi:lysozyme
MARKKRGFAKRIVIFVVLICAVAACFFYLVSSPARVRYPEFGIHIPPYYKIHGIDVSRYQHRIAWKEVEKMEVNGIRIGFAFVKATEGTDHIDPMYKRNWKNLRKTSLFAGAYHFFIASKSGKAQAVNFIRQVDLKTGDLPPVLDIEESYGVSKADIEQRVKDWLFMIERAYKTRPIIYTNPSFYKKFLKGKFDNYPLWIAHYQEVNRPGIDRDWILWQHSESGRVNGIRSAVDFNVFAGDSSDLVELLIK